MNQINRMFVCLCLLLSKAYSPLLAQTYQDDEDQSGLKLLLTTERDSTSRQIVTSFMSMDLGIGSFVFGDEPFVTPDFTDAWQLRTGRVGSHLMLNFFPTQLRLNPMNSVKLVYSLSLDFKQLYFGNNLRFARTPDNQVAWGLNANEEAFRKNKITLTYLTVPLMFQWNTRGVDLTHEGFGIDAGRYGGVRISTYQKIKDAIGDKTKIRDDFEFNDFQLGVMVKVRIRNYEFYGRYDLSNLNSQFGTNYASFGITIFNLDADFLNG